MIIVCDYKIIYIQQKKEKEGEKEKRKNKCREAIKRNEFYIKLKYRITVPKTVNVKQNIYQLLFTNEKECESENGIGGKGEKKIISAGLTTKMYALLTKKRKEKINRKLNLAKENELMERHHTDVNEKEKKIITKHASQMCLFFFLK